MRELLITRNMLVAEKEKIRKGGIEHYMLGLMEEVGELATAIDEPSSVKEPAHMEAVDVILAAVGAYFLTGGQNLSQDFETKLIKWESSHK